MPAPRPNARLRVRVVHEDASVLVVNKMPGMVTEPGKGHRADSLLNGLFAHDSGRFAHRLSRMGEARDWGLLHRLDRLTSGLVLIALEQPSYDALRAAFEARAVRKTYLAIARGDLPQSGEIARPLLERVENGIRINTIDQRGQSALTRWKTVARSGKYALVLCDLVTGRLHQIRVHFASLGAPIAGDPLYEAGGRARTTGRVPEAPELFLHAWRLAFPHPDTGATTSVEAPLPRRFATFATDHGLPLPNSVEA